MAGIIKKTGLLPPTGISNRLTPTMEKPENSNEKGFSSEIEKPMADSNGRYKRKPILSIAGTPYIPARLVQTQSGAYILFRVYDIAQKKLIRKRVFSKELSQIADTKMLQSKAAIWCAELNEALHNGHVHETTSKQFDITPFNFRGFTLLRAVEYAKATKESEHKNGTNYQKNIYNLKLFFQHKGITEKYLLKQLNRTFVAQYKTFLRTDRNLGPVTVNSLLSNLHTAVETLRKLDEKLLPLANPVRSFQREKVVKKKRAAYSPQQMARLRELIEPHDKQLLLYLQFIYFTLARPTELKNLRVGHIRLDVNKILIAGETAKTGIEQYVNISQTLASLIAHSGIMNYAADLYVFSNAGHPAPTRVGYNYFYKRYVPYLNATGFKKITPGLDLYSWKHSGAIALYMATKDAALVQAQCRHTTLAQTSDYLRDLGIFIDHEGFNKVPLF